MSDEKAEADVEADEARVDSRGGKDDDFVGRTAEDDPETMESGAEVRAAADAEE